MEGHVPTHLIDLHAAGALSPDQLATVNAHAASCADCAAKLTTAAKARDEFLARNPPAMRAEALLEQARPKSNLFRWLVPAFAFAAAVLIAFVVLIPKDDGITFKGGPAVSAWVKRPSTGRTWAPAPDEVLTAGDQLQLQVSPAGSKLVTVYVLEAGGAFTKLFSQPVKGATTLANSLTLDESSGSDTLFILFSDAELPELQRAQVENAETLQAGGATVVVKKWVVKKQ